MKKTMKTLCLFKGGPFHSYKGLFSESCIESLEFSVKGEHGFYKRDIKTQCYTFYWVRTAKILRLPFVTFVKNFGRINDIEDHTHELKFEYNPEFKYVPNTDWVQTYRKEIS